MLPQIRAILWAQWRTLLNFYPRGNMGSLVFTVTMSLVWYGMAATGAVGVAILFRDPGHMQLIERFLPTGLMFAFLYWQIVPILLVSTGASLDLKRLAVYPITHTQLFGLEVLLRLSTGIEMILVLTGATIGLLLNPSIPWWACTGFLPFIFMNLCLAAGLRDLVGRLLANRRIREAAIFGLVLLVALPQVLLMSGIPSPIRQFAKEFRFDWWPWMAAGRIAFGKSSVTAWSVLLAWTAAAYLFGRSQFERGFRFDSEEARATSTKPAGLLSNSGSLVEFFYRLPSRLFADPLGAIIEKEIRFLSRAPRFRLVFLMGFSFGLLIWLPIALRTANTQASVFASNYLAAVSLYALLLLGEVSFWNTFGFDRSASQIYYLLPVRFSTVLLAKNIAAAIFVFLEVTLVALICFILRMPVSGPKLLEAYSVSFVLSIFLMAIGNLGSTHYPRPVNPSHSWRSASAGRFQGMLLLIYPILSIPIMLAYLARYAFYSNWAFYGVLLFAAALGLVIYTIAMESSVQAAEERKEKFLTALSQGEGPVSA
ncbi:MAG: hypothetical protein JJE04_09065 [Acidobacteriia bacterium]|nr:hypothetical protein [Terriglobia bacterium]